MTFLSVLGSNNTSFIAKDNTIWLKNAPNLHQTPSRNIIRQRAGPHRITEMLSISDTFKKIMTMEMVDIIVRCTNKKAEAFYQEYNVNIPKESHIQMAASFLFQYSRHFCFSGIHHLL